MTEGVVLPANPHPCAACPWRIANQGFRTRGHFYNHNNLARLWSGLRRGMGMICHLTDPRMAEIPGYESTADLTQTHECSGALILMQRELYHFQTIVQEMDATGVTLPRAFSRYKQAHPGGLMQSGLTAIVARMVFQNTFLALPLPDLNLNESGIGYDSLGHWRPVYSTVKPEEP